MDKNILIFDTFLAITEWIECDIIELLSCCGDNAEGTTRSRLIVLLSSQTNVRSGKRFIILLRIDRPTF